MTALVISDLHLTPERPATRDRFEQFVRSVPASGDSLYVLGDLFEYWAGDDDLEDTFNREVSGALRACAGRGITLYWIPGNRDFLTGPAFATAARVTPLADPCVVDLYGERSVLLHGDSLCTDDRDYQSFRRATRSERWRNDFLARPLAARKAEITALRARSESEKADKPAVIMDVNEAAVAALFSASGAGRMIHGHTHRPGRHEYARPGAVATRWVLPAWDDVPGYLRVNGDGAELVYLD